MTYFDGIHLIADTIQELHEFALKCDLKKEWFQHHPRHPHYDVWGGTKTRNVIRLGAQIVSARRLIEIIKEHNTKN